MQQCKLLCRILNHRNASTSEFSNTIKFWMHHVQKTWGGEKSITDEVVSPYFINRDGHTCMIGLLIFLKGPKRKTLLRTKTVKLRRETTHYCTINCETYWGRTSPTRMRGNHQRSGRNKPYRRQLGSPVTAPWEVPVAPRESSSERSCRLARVPGMAAATAVPSLVGLLHWR